MSHLSYNMHIAHWAKIGGHMDLQIVRFRQFSTYSNVIHIKMR